MVAPTSQYAKQSKLLRFSQSPHAVFRFSAGSPLPGEKWTGPCGLLIRLAGLALPRRQIRMHYPNSFLKEINPEPTPEIISVEL